ncbi:MAG: DNA-3-methyladenine glycosylase family protein [Halobacteriota archaeon]
MNKRGVEASGRFEIEMPEPFDFSLTVSKPAGWHWSTPGEVFENGVLWTGCYVDGRPVGLKMTETRKTVAVSVYATSELTRDETALLRANVEFGLGRDEDLGAFYAFADNDEILSVAAKDLYGMRAGRLDDIFGRVILAITLQMAPYKRSRDMMSSLLEAYGTKIAFEGKEIALWPTPAHIAGLEPSELRRSANLGYRAERLIKSARYLAEHPISLEELNVEPEAEAMRRLNAVPGIGTYSARLIVGRTSVPIDVWSVVILSELLLGRAPENPRKEIDAVTNEVNERWGEWSWMAFVYVLNDLRKLATIYKLSRLI